MADLPNASIKRLLTANSDGLRTSSSAVQLAAAAAEAYVARLAREAGANAARERRKKIMDEDINKAKEAVG